MPVEPVFCVVWFAVWANGALGCAPTREKRATVCGGGRATDMLMRVLRGR